MVKKFVLSSVGVLLLVSPMISWAQTTSAQAQIDALLKQLAQLQAQIAMMRGQSTITPITSASSCATFTRDFSSGASDAKTNGEVSKLQQFLMSAGVYPEASVTGYFGPATSRALQRWQTANGIAVTTPGIGAFGPKTRAAIKVFCTNNEFSAPPSTAQLNYWDKENSGKKLFITPGGVPTLNITDGWNTQVMVDKSINSDGVVGNFEDRIAIQSTYKDNLLPTGIFYRVVNSNVNDFEEFVNLYKTSFLQRALVSSEGYGADLNYSYYDFVYRTGDGMGDLPDIFYVGKTRIVNLGGHFYILDLIIKDAGNQSFLESEFDTYFSTINFLNFDSSYLSLSKYKAFFETLYPGLSARLIAERNKLQGSLTNSITASYCPTALPFGSQLYFGFTASSPTEFQQISDLQRFLRARYGLSNGVMKEGIYDADTFVYLVGFQREIGLKGTGNIGTKTIGVLSNCKLNTHPVQNTATTYTMPTVVQDASNGYGTLMLMSALNKVATIKLTNKVGGGACRAIDVYWGDGASSYFGDVCGTILTHEYGNAGVYNITIPAYAGSQVPTIQVNISN